jgi:hypothetical protein
MAQRSPNFSSLSKKRSSIPEHFRNKGLLKMLSKLEPIDEDFPEIEDIPPEPVDLFE